MQSVLRDFCAGCAAYPSLELLWRGRTHWTMALAGGCGLALLGALKQRTSLPLYGQALLGGAGITAIELAFGLCCNRRHNVWDYRRMPMQFRGQVCLPYALLWCGLSAAVLRVYRAT